MNKQIGMQLFSLRKKVLDCQHTLLKHASTSDWIWSQATPKYLGNAVTCDKRAARRRGETHPLWSAQQFARAIHFSDTGSSLRRISSVFTANTRIGDFLSLLTIKQNNIYIYLSRIKFLLHIWILYILHDHRTKWDIKYLNVNVNPNSRWLFNVGTIYTK